MSDIIQSETLAGETITVGKKEITPFSKSLKVMIPGLTGGLIWNRPHSVLVQSGDGQEQVYPVIDFTRQVMWIMMATSAVGLLLMVLFSKRKSNSR